MSNALPDASTPHAAPNRLQPVLQATALHWHWGGPALLHFETLDIPPGITWISGGEGRGKSTLLRLLAGDLVAPGSTDRSFGFATPPAQAALHAV